MGTFCHNLRWIGTRLLHVSVALFLIETIVLAIEGVSGDFGGLEIVSAVLIAGFVIGTFSLLVFLPLGTILGYGAGPHDLRASARSLFHTTIRKMRTSDSVSRRRFVGLSTAGALGTAALVLLALFPVLKLITTVQTPIFAAVLSVIATGLAGVISLAAWPVWRRTGMLVARIPVRMPSPLTLIAGFSGATLAGLALFAALTWENFSSYIPWRGIIVTGLTVILFGAFAVLTQYVPLTPGRRTRRILGGGVLTLYLIGGALFFLIPVSLERAPYLVEDADGLLGAVYSRLTRAVDFDDDGYLPWLAQGDCAPSDGSIHPGAIDIPKDHIDQNCDGKDSQTLKTTHPGRHDYTAKRRFKPMPVILVTLDAVSAVYLDLYGAKRKTMPFLARQAKQGVVFQHAFSEGPSTRLSFPSLLASRHNSQIRREYRSQTTVPWINVRNTIGTVFSKAGYRTEAVTPDHYFAESMGWFYEGFERVDRSAARGYCGQFKNSEQVTRTSLKRLDRLKDLDKFFFWVHYTDAHPPHKLPGHIKPFFGISPRDIYHRELRMLDDALKTLFQGIEKRLSHREYIIALTADHGEAFDKAHKKWHHGHDLSTAVTRVPLVFWSPFGKGRRSDQLAQIIDVMPTLMNMVGLKATGLAGESLLPAIQGKPDLDRPIMQQFYLHERRLKGWDPLVAVSIRKGPYVLHQRQHRKDRLFDFKKDPYETMDLIEKKPGIARELGDIRNDFLRWAYGKWNRLRE